MNLVDIAAWTLNASALARERMGGVAATITSPLHADSGYVLDLDGERVMAQFIVWPSGAVEASAVVVATNERVYFKDATAADMQALDALLDDLLRFVADIEAGVDRESHD